MLAGDKGVGDEDVREGGFTMANSIRESMVADQWGPRLAYLGCVSKGSVEERLETYIFGPARGSAPPIALRSTALPASADAA